MKILCVHNFYGSEAPSGENLIYRCEIDLLRKFGHSVIECTTSSDELRAAGGIGKLRGAASCIYNAVQVRRLREIVDRERPDVMHVHNTFPRFSPAIMWATKDTTTASVLTLHNARMFCASGVAVRDGLGCTLCADLKSVRPALRYRCYRGSFFATLPVATMIEVHRRLRTFPRCVDAFISLTKYQRQFLVERHLVPSERVHVRPNFMPGRPIPLPWEDRGNYATFVGRITAQKGLGVLLDAWKMWGSEAPRLLIVGDGEEREKFEAKALIEAVGGKISFLGGRTNEEAIDIIRASKLIVIPSLGAEGFPLVVREACAYGVPIVASDLGALQEIVAANDCGSVFPAGDPVALASLLRDLWTDESRLRGLSRRAILTYRMQYSEDSAHARLLEIYAMALAYRQSIRLGKTEVDAT